MKIKKYLLIFILLLAGLISNVWSQNELVKGYYDEINDWFVFEWDRPDYGKTTTIYDPPNKINPVIIAHVNYNEKNSEYIYSYEVTNIKGTKQNLIDILIKFLAPIYDAKSPEPKEEWYMDEYRGKDAFMWSKTGGDIAGIKGGQTVTGLSFKSYGVPVIVNAAFLGDKRAVFSPPGDYDTDEIIESFSKVFEGLEGHYKDKFDYVMRKTISAYAPPADLKPLKFLDYIINMKHEAFSLGWIRSKGIEQSLDAKLNNAKKKIEQGNINAAKNILNALLNEVEAQGCEAYEKCPEGKHLTPEAYALLKYNVKYLLEHIN